MKTMRLIFTLLPLALAAMILIPLQWLALAMGWTALSGRLPQLFHKVGCFCLKIKVHCDGVLSSDRPLLLTCNHVSWLDIMVLGSIMPVSFVAKSEVRGWPLIGAFARLQRSLFINRGQKTQSRTMSELLGRRLAGGDIMVLFAEGTSSNGVHVQPFRSSLLGAVKTLAAQHERTPLHVQPLALRYTHLHGLPLGQADHPRLAWYGDMSLVPHLLDILSGPPVDVRVSFGETLVMTQACDRKKTSRLLHHKVRKLLQNTF
jgi:1-acyl-sn-glycerol-3-phosphate acyltransferase